MRLAPIILASIAAGFVAPSYFRRWQQFRQEQAMKKARRKLTADVFPARLVFVDPDTQTETDLRVFEGNQGAFAIDSAQPAFAVLMQLAPQGQYFSLGPILTVPANERAYFTFDNDMQVVWLPPKLSPQELRFGGVGRLYYALVSRSREALDELLAAEKMTGANGIPAETLNGFPLAVVPA